MNRVGDNLLDLHSFYISKKAHFTQSLYNAVVNKKQNNKEIVKMKKKIITGLLALAMVVTSISAIPANQVKAASSLSGTITLSGSTSVSPLAQELAKRFKKENPNVRINFTNITGSGAGITDVTNGVVDIGMSSRALKTTERASLTENVICNDGVAIVVNRKNPLSNITAQQLFDVYTKKTTNWSTLAKAFSKTVAIYSREDGSGTKGCFEDVLKNDYSLDIAKKYGTIDAVIPTTGAMQTSVKNNQGAIGYMSLGDLDATQVKALKFNGVEANIYNVANGTYKMSRPFVFATKGTPSKQAQAFIDWCKTNATAQSIVSKMGFVKLGLVKINPRSVKFSKKTLTLKKGKKKSLKYTVYPANSSNKAVTFKTSNKKIVTVSKKGVVKAKKVGTAKITIKTVEGKRKATIKIKVK